MYKELRFIVSGTDSMNVSAFTDINKSPNPTTANVLVSLTGFEEQENVEIMTESKLNGNGSYFIGYHIAEKEVSFEINVPSGFNTLYRNVRNISLNPVGNKCSISIYTYEDNGSIDLIETLTGGFIKSVRSTDLTNIDKDWGTISITCLFTDPTITTSVST